jgi:hypothetical protein
MLFCSWTVRLNNISEYQSDGMVKGDQNVSLHQMITVKKNMQKDCKQLVLV